MPILCRGDLFIHLVGNGLKNIQGTKKSAGEKAIGKKNRFTFNLSPNGLRAG